MRELTEAVVVVVGATGRLGSAISSELGRRGAVVLGAGRRGPDIELDIRDSHAGDAVVRGALGTQGRLDGVVNAAGIVAVGDLVDTDEVTIEELFLTNTLGPMWLARLVLPTLAQSRGFFAAVTGVAAERPQPGRVPYGASKAALAHALVGLRGEASRLGVHVADFRPPHAEANGPAPELVARRVVDAIERDEPELGGAAFAA